MRKNITLAEFITISMGLFQLFLIKIQSVSDELFGDLFHETTDNSKESEDRKNLVFRMY